MTEYWKSNAKKFCDFCKCWFADNKPSIEFHERGKKHQENVQTRLQEIGKKGREDYDNKLKESDYMKEMEEAAMRAYKKDIESNPDFTGAEVAKIAQMTYSKIVIGQRKNENSLHESSKKQYKKNDDGNNKKKNESESNMKWREAKSPEGYSYYWNEVTGESVWEAPAEGYIKLEKDQKKVEENKTQPDNDSQSTPASNLPLYGPASRSDPFGTWENAKPVTDEVDLQLPSFPDEADYYSVPEVVVKNPEIKFEEKQVRLTDVPSASAGPVSFKRKKASEGQKKNVRRRIQD